MTKKWKRIVCTALATAAVTGWCAAPATRASTQTFDGAGARDCSAWTETRATLAKDVLALIHEGMMLSWVQGFLNGMNARNLEERTAGRVVPDAAEIRTQLDRLCVGEPRTSLLVISARMFANLPRQRQ